MGILNSLFGNKIVNENKSKPFYQNSNATERKDWFARTRPWNRIAPKTIEALVNKFGENPMFELFVITSMEQNLIAQYEQLNNQNYEESVICSIIAAMLCKLGTTSVKQMMTLLQSGKGNINKATEYGKIALDALEPAIIIDQEQITAFSYLSLVNGLMGRNEEALKYAQQGIEVIQEMRGHKYPFHLSNDGKIKNADQNMEAIEKQLKQIVDARGQIL